MWVEWRKVGEDVIVMGYAAVADVDGFVLHKTFSSLSRGPANDLCHHRQVSMLSQAKMGKFIRL